ncbi:DUF2953 domain-containing protein [Oceanobacillus piezotolerans]|uniref:DUF2953 domain-containing protein n=1 Tax=Oceanobacillus piezotolerans TaxID=2448030 RepID=UPI001314F374|nr:DUF2953 domain-containing protein [Oceanobacillus piezotolerans]
MPIQTQSNIDIASSLEDKDSETFNLNWDNLTQTVKKYNKIMNTMTNGVNLHSLHWSTSLGTGEASSTGIVTGSVWTMKSSVIGLLCNKLINQCQPFIAVNPNFGQEEFQTRLSCMVSIKLGKAIRTILKVSRISREKI